MADVKISGLPAATTPLAGTEVLPIVQSGATKKVSVDNLTAGKAVSASSVTATNLKTSPTTANIDISGTTIAASGSDANVDVNINAKGTGVAYLNQRWGVNASGALVASAGNTYDIGNGTNNPRDVNIDRYAVMNGLTASKAVFTDASKNLTTTGTVEVAQGGTGVSSASITAFNNITGYTATGATGATSSSLVFSSSPNLTTPDIGVATGTSIALGTSPATAGPVRIPNNTFLQSKNAADSGNIPLIGLSTANVTQIAQGVGATFANGDVADLGSLQTGLLVVVSNFDNTGIFVISNLVVYELSDPDNKFSVTKDTASSINIYNNAGNVNLQNNSGGSRSFYICHIK